MKLYNYHEKSNISGERIRIAREKLHISQEQLAAKMQIEGFDINQKSISRIETGLRVVPDYEVPYLAKALNVSVLWLLGME